jgi:hypothetical protein
MLPMYGNYSCLPGCTFLAACPPACLPACLRGCRPVSLPACLPPCSPARLPVHEVRALLMAIPCVLAAGVCTTDLAAGDCYETHKYLGLSFDKICPKGFCRPYYTNDTKDTKDKERVYTCSTDYTCKTTADCGFDSKGQQLICPMGEQRCPWVVRASHLLARSCGPLLQAGEAACDTPAAKCMPTTH